MWVNWVIGVGSFLIVVLLGMVVCWLDDRWAHKK